MKPIGIITDSHCGISVSEAEKLGVKVLPMPLYIDDECYYEGKSITRKAFFEKLKECEKVSTSQASPADVMDMWDEMLKEYETILCMPMSSGLSGACNTQKLFSDEDEYSERVFVVDNGRISTPMHQTILDAIELIDEGYSAKEIKDILESTRFTSAKSKLSFALGKGKPLLRTQLGVNTQRPAQQLFRAGKAHFLL